ncbi:MAG TPA: cation:proton antiporter [Myxococcota bacterium]|nr:cation:proton antiporter [Myxococcota bacterium]
MSGTRSHAGSPFVPIRLARTTVAYAAMIIATVAIFWGIRAVGEARSSAAALVPLESAATVAKASGETLFHVLLALVVVITVARGMGVLFRRFHQPAVIGEVVAGILLGPSLLGRVAPEASAFLLPPSVAPFLGMIAQVGVILYMFLVGLELDTGLLRHRAHASVAVSHASIIVPFLLGSALALWLYPGFAPVGVRFTVFALFMGVSLSVTAFPVLARILTDRGMQGTRMGSIALACAAVDDVTAWCLLAFLVSVVQAEPGHVLVTVGLTAAFIVAMLVLVRPAARRLALLRDSQRVLTQTTFAVVCVGLLLSALATESIGIHALFGAFLLGALVPHDSALARDVRAKVEDLVLVLLLPAFFAFTGMRTQIGLVHGGGEWLLCAVIIGVASLGKFGGSAVAARLTGLGWRQAASLGILMNTRGLMELIVLNLGLDLGVLSPKLFAMLVLMAVVTTFGTTPILHALRLEEDRAPRGAHALPG